MSYSCLPILIAHSFMSFSHTSLSAITVFILLSFNKVVNSFNILTLRNDIKTFVVHNYFQLRIFLWSSVLSWSALRIFSFVNASLRLIILVYYVYFQINQPAFLYLNVQHLLILWRDIHSSLVTSAIEYHVFIKIHSKEYWFTFIELILSFQNFHLCGGLFIKLLFCLPLLHISFILSELVPQNKLSYQL